MIKALIISKQYPSTFRIVWVDDITGQHSKQASSVAHLQEAIGELFDDEPLQDMAPSEDAGVYGIDFKPGGSCSE